MGRLRIQLRRVGFSSVTAGGTEPGIDGDEGRVPCGEEENLNPHEGILPCDLASHGSRVGDEQGACRSWTRLETVANSAPMPGPRQPPHRGLRFAGWSFI